jgi:hypothetical protein
LGADPGDARAAVGGAAPRDRLQSLPVTPSDERAVCFDNAHPVAVGSGPARRRSEARDHSHKGAVVAPYAYRDAATLLEDFWNEVEKWLREWNVG